MSNQLKGRAIDTDRIKDLTGIVENFHLGGEGNSSRVKKVKMAMKDTEGEGLFFPGQSYESQGGKGMFFPGQSASSQGGKGLKKLKLNISSHNAGSSKGKKSGGGLREY